MDSVSGAALYRDTSSITCIHAGSGAVPRVLLSILGIERKASCSRRCADGHWSKLHSIRILVPVSQFSIPYRFRD